MIHYHKARWAAIDAGAGLGVSCECKGLSHHSISPENQIWIEFCGEISRNMQQ